MSRLLLPIALAGLLWTLAGVDASAHATGHGRAKHERPCRAGSARRQTRRARSGRARCRSRPGRRRAGPGGEPRPMAPVQARSPAAAALTQPAGAEEPAVAATQPSANAPFRFFSASSFWNTPVAGASVDPGSRELIGSLESEIAREDSLPGGPSETIDTTSYSVPIYTVA